ncbi:MULTISPECIES: UPF0149 family protein [Pseudomonas]|uniref:UPF0149 family protein n=1 Tax=Pseudomonas TaxID=286 RepID=UPI000A1E703E|nr:MULTISPECIES: UPF0149 family protein [Pseudomonas]CAB5648746.1 Predicted metal-binding protein related to the C-terminal domain of SecA [Pseudomonas putida]MBO2925221.1 UPF0149 family protein [Pseudomonas asiatica]MCO8264833.1 UPF0149 family protein [Pseudomonas asiatica]MDH4433006.1 UPF0149 family protein [Pseudomonas shirazica]PJI73171.1 metal-binding protein [Pseudomonas sp. MR 02]
MSNPITDQELDELGELLFKYGNDDAILDVSELDGFVNALCSSPHMLPPSEWLPEVSGGKLPRFKSKAQAQRYTDLIIKFYNTVAIMLSEATDELNLFFEVRDTAQGEIVVLEEWCFGYMRGVRLGRWTELPAHLQKYLDAIALHGSEENFSVLDKMSLEEHQATVPLVVDAVHVLYLYQRQQRLG